MSGPLRQVFDGHEYMRYDEDSIWTAIENGPLHRCTCGSTTFEVWASNDYETSARCTACKHSQVIHNG